MSRGILIFGQSGAGKTYSLKNLDPEKTFIIDADQKGAFPWRGSKVLYNKEKNNYRCTDNLDTVQTAISSMGTEKYAHITTLVIDGLTKALATFLVFYDELHTPKNPYEKYDAVYKKAVRIFKLAKEIKRDDLTVVFIGNVELPDPYVIDGKARLKTPGQAIRKYEDPESNLNYVFYAKKADGKYIFETNGDSSTAKSPPELFEPEIDNDLAAIISAIEEYEFSEKGAT